MSRKLYMECYSGISGDMTVAALLDLGVDGDYLKEELSRLGLDGYEIRISRTKKNQIAATDFDVILTEESCGHSHEHSHGGHTHTHEEHTHGHGAHTHEIHTHVHNSYKEITEFIKNCGLKEHVKEISLKIFDVIARAEAKVHETSVEDVHFHEVGAVDSIVDIVSAAICLDALGFDEIYTSELWEGKGTTWCQHGRIPVPAPAVLEMFAAHRIPVHFTSVEGEMITPTGAGIVAALAKREPLPKRFVIEKTGTGAGKKDFPHANVLRAMIITEEEYQKTPQNNSTEQLEVTEKEHPDVLDSIRVCVLETNVDDCSGEQLGYAMECLLAAGALDASCMPLFMKKNRPAYMLQVICRPDMEKEMENIIFRETTSIGLRHYEEERSILPREIITVKLSSGHEVKVKKCTHHGQAFFYPEYESVKEVCAATGRTYKSQYDEAIKAAKKENLS